MLESECQSAPNTSPSSSGGQSSGFLNRVSGVRVAPGVPFSTWSDWHNRVLIECRALRLSSLPSTTPEPCSSLKSNRVAPEVLPYSSSEKTHSYAKQIAKIKYPEKTSLQTCTEKLLHSVEVNIYVEPHASACAGCRVACELSQNS
jgi:hypothetical protein